jgi:hypothetical protein
VVTGFNQPLTKDARSRFSEVNTPKCPDGSISNVDETGMSQDSGEERPRMLVTEADELVPFRLVVIP